MMDACSNILLHVGSGIALKPVCIYYDVCTHELAVLLLESSPIFELRSRVQVKLSPVPVLKIFYINILVACGNPATLSRQWKVYIG